MNFPGAVKSFQYWSQKHEFLIFRGTEITTDQGDMLVFGYHEDITGIIPIELLGKEVVEADGFIIAAHPFRGFLTFDAAHLGLTPEKAMQRPLFKLIHALELTAQKRDSNPPKKHGNIPL